MSIKKINFNQKIIQVNLRDEVDSSVFNEIFKYREYRQVEDIITTTSGTILDIGAHAGFFSLYAASLNDNTKIYALEPEPHNFLALKENTKLNPQFNQIKLFNLALDSRTGSGLLYLSPDSHNHSLLKESNQGQTELSIKTITLNDFCSKQKISRISLLKMDIEGGEHDIIKNLSPAELSLIDHLFLEVHKTGSNSCQSLEEILRPAGFSVQIFPCQFDSDLKFMLANNKRKR